MNYFEKSFNLSLLDLIIVALVGGLLTLAIGKIFSVVLKHSYIKLKKPSKKLIKSLKVICKVKEKKRLMKKYGYDQALYNETNFDSKYRYLFPSEKSYLKEFSKRHREETEKKTNQLKSILTKSRIY